ncbi:MAG: hypothetical protein AABZ39_15025 [Spirochaetota bacterium]
MEHMTARNTQGVTITLDEDADGSGIESIRIGDSPFGPTPEKSLFFVRVSGSRDSLIPVRLPVVAYEDVPEAFAWQFSGTKVIRDAAVTFNVHLKLMKNIPAITMDIHASCDRDVPARIEAAFCSSTSPSLWHAHIYPWAENSLHLPEEIDNAYASIYSEAKTFPVTAWKGKLFNWCGVPAVFFRNEDRSISFLFGVSKDCEYGKPGSWMEELSVESAPEEPVRIVSGSRDSIMKAGTEYHIPVQLIFSAAPDYLEQPRELVHAWTSLNSYTARAIPHPTLETTKAMMEFMIEGRRNAAYFIDGATYRCDQHRKGYFDTYIINTPFNIYLDLLLSKYAGDAGWYERAVTQFRWLKRMRVNDPADRNFGAFYPIAPEGKAPQFYRYKGACEEFEIEQNARAGYWLLKIAEAVKNEELEALPGQDELSKFALETLRWVKAQQQSDGSIPQKAALNGTVNGPVTPAHSLLAFRYAHKITGDSAWKNAMLQAEQWTMRHSIETARFFGAHSDLHPQEYEEGSIHVLTSYALARHHDTGDRFYIRLADYLASLSFFMRCPKQIPWSTKPTQGCNVEQSHYLQYSLYSYYSSKYLNFIRLSEITGDPFFAREGHFLMRQSAHCIVTGGPWKSAHYERIADPWLARKDDLTPEGNIYASELAPELLYQLLVLENPDVLRQKHGV